MFIELAKRIISTYKGAHYALRIFAALCIVLLLLLLLRHLLMDWAEPHISVSMLKTIALALHAYRDENGSLPHTVKKVEAYGVIHSWRVSILPYFEDHPKRRRLYTRYRFEEKWDSPNNGAVADDGQYWYSGRGQSGKHAGYLAVATEGNEWFAEAARKIADSGFSRNDPVLLIEYPLSDVLWTEPRDLYFNGNRVVLEELNGRGKPIDVGGLRAITYTGTVFAFPRTSSPDELRAVMYGTDVQ